MIECSFCGYENPDGAVECNNCHFELGAVPLAISVTPKGRKAEAETAVSPRALIGLRASFIWWWVIALLVNFLVVIVLSYPVNGILTWMVESSTEWFSSGCFEDMGFWGCALFYLFLGWWIIIIALIIYSLLWLLLKLWPLLGPIGFLFVVPRVLNALRPSADPLLSHLKWPDYLGAIVSFPVSYLAFLIILRAPPSPMTPAEIIVSILPPLLENMWFIATGLLGWVFTWSVLSLLYKGEN